jgi:hypothetical protein
MPGGKELAPVQRSSESGRHGEKHQDRPTGDAPGKPADQEQKTEDGRDRGERETWQT